MANRILREAIERHKANLRGRVVEEPSSPTGFAVLGARGRGRHFLHLDTHRGPGYKIDASGRIYLDLGREGARK